MNLGRRITTHHWLAVGTEWRKVYRYLAARLIPLRSRRIDTLWENTYDKIYAAIVLHYTNRPLVHADKSRYTLEHRPTAMDIAWMQECEELFIDSGIPNESALRAHLNTVVAPRVPQLVALWEERFKARLRELVLAVVSPADVSKDIDPLDLAVAVFGCTYCEISSDPYAQEPTAVLGPPLALRFPEILAHKCFHKYSRWHSTSAPLPTQAAYQQHILKREREREKQMTWRLVTATCPIDADRISLAGARRACAALLGAHCDPSRITFQEMETWDSNEGMWIPPAHMIVKAETTTANVRILLRCRMQSFPPNWPYPYSLSGMTPGSPTPGLNPLTVDYGTRSTMPGGSEWTLICYTM